MILSTHARFVSIMFVMNERDEHELVVSRLDAAMYGADHDRMLSTRDVLDRYGIKGHATAAKIIRAAGGRKIGGRWRISLAQLRAYEQAGEPEETGVTLPMPVSRGVVPATLDGDWWHTPRVGGIR